jgi:hypothetical protein
MKLLDLDGELNELLGLEDVLDLLELSKAPLETELLLSFLIDDIPDVAPVNDELLGGVALEVNLD